MTGLARHAETRGEAPNSVNKLERDLADVSHVHTWNKVAVVVWELVAVQDDYAAAITNAVMAGWDTDGNGATGG